MVMRRGEIYDADLDPTQGSEQAGTRPVIIVSRDAINTASSVVICVPCTTMRKDRRLFPSHALIRAPEGALSVDSVALCEQVRAVSRVRLRSLRGSLSPQTLERVDRALSIALDL